MASAANFVFCASWFSVFFVEMYGNIPSGPRRSCARSKKKPKKTRDGFSEDSNGSLLPFLEYGENNFSGGPNFGSNVYSTRIVTCSYNLKLINCAKRSS